MATRTGFYVQKIKLLHHVGVSENGFTDLKGNGIDGCYYMGMARIGEDMTYKVPAMCSRTVLIRSEDGSPQHYRVPLDVW
ncbi:uncharacterized protein LOC143932516 [Lithobates pipiens]